jgi:hypothetical protein
MTSALRREPVPDMSPPLDVSVVTDRSSLVQQRSGQPDCRGVQGTLTLVVGGVQVPQELGDDVGPIPTPSRGLPDPRMLRRGLVQVLVEVMAGHRSATQLLRWTTSDVYAKVRAQTLPPPRPGTKPTRRLPRVTSIHSGYPADDVVEICAVVAGQYRTQAIALRIEGVNGRWIVTALETG